MNFLHIHCLPLLFRTNKLQQYSMGLETTFPAKKKIVTRLEAREADSVLSRYQLMHAIRFEEPRN
jgi:hypothetical protein